MKVCRVSAWFTVAALSLPLSAVAQPIRLPGTQPNTLTARLEPAAQCQECHSTLEHDGHTYLAHDTWAPSMMANAARDPLFLATLQVANAQIPDVGNYCLRCHTPSGFTAGRAMPGTGEHLDPLLDNDGVHCDTCHRSLDPRAQMPAIPIGSAQLVFSDAPMGMLPARQGPRTDPFMSPRHPSVGNPFIRDSAMCGQCHDIDNPVAHRLSMTGMDTGQPFPLQSTYTEWTQSNFSRGATTRTCQDCHMPAETGDLAVTRIPGAPTRMNPRRHDFVGGNEWGIAMLRQAFPGELDAEFDAQRMRNQAFLRTAARLEITSAPMTVAAGSTAMVQVRVTNLSGHKLPTGYEDARLMWLQLQAGTAVVSGDYQMDELVRDAQARIYRFQAGHFEAGRVTESDFVARHNVVLEDTRIPPEGMMPNDRTTPVGRDYSGGPGGALRNYDTVTYNVPIPAGAPNGPMPITVRLLFQSTTKHYVETITGAAPGTPRATALLNAWNRSGRAAPFAMATATVMATVTGGTTPQPDAGVPDGGVRDGGTDGGTVRDGSTDAPTTDVSATDAGRDSSTDAGAPPAATDPGGCNCRTDVSSPSSVGSFALLGLVAAVRRRRRTR